MLFSFHNNYYEWWSYDKLFTSLGQHEIEFDWPLRKNIQKVCLPKSIDIVIVVHGISK